MVRKYRFADIASIIILLLDLSSLFLFNGFKKPLILCAIPVLVIGIMVRTYYPATIDSMIKLFDANIAWTTLCFIFAAVREIEYIAWIVPSIIACALALVIILFARSGTDVVKGKVFALIIFGIILLLAFLFTNSFASAAGGAVVSVFDAIGKVFSYIGHLITAIVTFLMDLLPNIEGGPRENFGMEGDLEKAPLEEVVSSPAGVGLVIVVAIIALFAVIEIIKFVTRYGLPKFKKAEKAAIIKKKRTKFSLAISGFGKALMYNLKMLLYMAKTTPLAKYYRLVLSKRFSPKHKLKSETPREFIKRVSDLDSKFIDSVEVELYRGR